MKLVLRLSALLLLAAPAALPAQVPVETRQIGSAMLENVPPIPAEVKAAVQRYQNYREARWRSSVRIRTALCQSSVMPRKKSVRT